MPEFTVLDERGRSLHPTMNCSWAASVKQQTKRGLVCAPAIPEYDEQAGQHRHDAGGQSHPDLGCMGCCAAISSTQFIGHPTVQNLLCVMKALLWLALLSANSSMPTLHHLPRSLYRDASL